MKSWTDRTPRLATDALGLLEAAGATGDEVAEVRVGPLKAVVISHPTLIREVLVERPDDFPKGRRQHAALRPVLGYGLLTSDGDLHRRQRRLVQPTLVPAEIDRQVGVMVDEAAAAADAWPRGVCDVVPLVNALAMDIVGRMLFGRALRDEGALAASIVTAFEWEMRALSGVVAPAWVPTPGNRRMRAAVASIDARLNELAGQSHAPPADSRTILDALRQRRDADGMTMARPQLLDEVRTIWGAAHETSADAQAWCLDLLARHPEVQERLAREIDESGGSGNLDLADLEAIPYAMAVFKEALRLYPPAAAMLRAARRSTTLGGVRLRAGTLVFISPYLMHRRDDLFPDPLRFDPDRFGPDRAQETPRHAYLPFGVGKRACVGSYMALLEGQALTATLVQRLRFAPADPRPPDAELVINLRPARGVRLVLTDRSDRQEG